MPREVPYEIWFGKNADPNITALSATSISVWADAHKFRCPQGMKILLRPGDTLSTYLEANDAEIVAPPAQVQIEVRDPSEQRRELVYGPSMYLSTTDFQQKTHMAKLRLDHPIVVSPRDWIVIMLFDDTAMDANDLTTDSYGVLRTTKLID